MSNAIMCPTTQCTTCWCPKEHLSDLNVVHPFRDTADIRERVAEESKKLIQRNGRPRDRCREKVSTLGYLCHMNDAVQNYGWIITKIMNGISRTMSGIFVGKIPGEVFFLAEVTQFRVCLMHSAAA